VLKQINALTHSQAYYYLKLKVLSSPIIEMRFSKDIFSCPFSIHFKFFLDSRRKHKQMKASKCFWTCW